MDNRRAALHKILSATGVESRLTDLQCRELLDHLEDSMEQKMIRGLPEGDALVQSFEAMGNLDELAREMQGSAPLAFAAEGVLLLPAKVKVLSRVCVMGLAYLMLLWTVLPKFSAFMKDMDATLQIPWAMRLLLQMSSVGGSGAWWGGTLFVMGGIAWWVSRLPWTRKEGNRVLRISGWVFFLITVISLALPILYIVGVAGTDRAFAG